MRKNIRLAYAIVMIFIVSGARAQQICPGNLLTNGQFSGGMAGGWTAFAPAVSWQTSSKSGCIDSFIFIGTGGTGGGLAQNINFVATHCYSLCICLAPQSSSMFSRIKVYAANNDPGITYASLKTNSFPSGAAQVIDSFNVNGTATPATYCKNNWIAAAGYTRLIIIITAQPPNLGAEAYLDNVCLLTCANGIHSQLVEEIKIINSEGRIYVRCNNKSFNLELSDLSGKLLNHFIGVTEFNLPKYDLSPGIYILRISKEGAVYTKRIVL